MDASEFGLEAVIYAILAVLVGVPLVGLLIAATASRLGGRRFGFGSIGMGIVVSVASVVVVVVLQRTISGRGDRLGSALGGRSGRGRGLEPASLGVAPAGIYGPNLTNPVRPTVSAAQLRTRACCGRDYAMRDLGRSVAPALAPRS